MPHELRAPLTYLITSGATSAQTTPQSKEFKSVISLVEAAAQAGVSLVQLREKAMRPCVLFDLVIKCRHAINSRPTLLLVNDRADIARAGGADGVHLTTQSIPARIVRQVFGPDFLIGVSTHSAEEVSRAREALADFVTFGPVFLTPSKEQYGAPVGLHPLAEATSANPDFPVMALGGIETSNVVECFRHGASGIAGIRLFANPLLLPETVRRIRTEYLQSARVSET
jgi:thiamine-phosphate pyrophosphorylase